MRDLHHYIDLMACNPEGHTEQGPGLKTREITMEALETTFAHGFYHDDHIDFQVNPHLIQRNPHAFQGCFSARTRNYANPYWDSV